MIELIRTQAFLVAILAGACAQLLKVIVFLVAERRVNYRRFVQADGAPNMHSTAFSALMVAVGLKEGFGSIEFAFAACLTSIIFVDTMNVKNATSRQKEAILLLLDRLRSKGDTVTAAKAGRSYSPADVFSGMVLGVVFALIVM